MSRKSIFQGIALFFTLLLSFSVVSAENLKENALRVRIDIMPGSEQNTLNLKSKGVIPVAILTTDQFDATSVDASSVKFGPEEASIAHKKGHLEDVDQDGNLDLLLHFRMQATGIQCGEIIAQLSGLTITGTPFQGGDLITTIGCSLEVSPIISVETTVLDEESLQHLVSVSSDNATYVFAQTTQQLDELEPGDIVAGGVSSNAPFGFLRKVGSITPVGGQIVIQTTGATLEEAVEAGYVEAKGISLTPADIQSSSYLGGVVLGPPVYKNAKPAALFSYQINDVVLFDLDGNQETDNDQIIANGGISVETAFDFSFVIKDGQLDLLTFTNTTVQDANLKIEADLAYTLQEEKLIARHLFTPLTFFVGPVPVVLIPEMTVHVGVDGRLHVNVVTSVTQDASLVSGLQYTAHGGWTPISEFSNEFEFVPPVVTASMNAKGYATERLTINLYGVSGPHADVSEYLLLEADINRTPWWSLFGGLEASVGVDLTKISRSLANFEILLLDYRVLLAQAETPPPPTATATTTLTATLTATPTMTATATATDVPTSTPTQTPIPQVPPENDDFDNAFVILNYPYTNTQEITFATTAGDDPILPCAAHQATPQKVQSVWYTLVAPSDGDLSISTNGSNYETVTAVWSGNRGSLSSHGCNYVTPFNVTLTGGTTYYIEVAAWDAPGNPRTLQLAVDFTTSSCDFQSPEGFSYSDGTVPCGITYAASGGTVRDLAVQNGKLQANIDTNSYGNYTRIDWIPNGISFGANDQFTLEYEGTERTGFTTGNWGAYIQILPYGTPVDTASVHPLLTILAQNRYQSQIDIHGVDSSGTGTVLVNDMYAVSDGTHNYKLEINHVNGSAEPGALRFYRDGVLVGAYDGVGEYLSESNILRFFVLGDDPAGATHTWDNMTIDVQPGNPALPPPNDDLDSATEVGTMPFSDTLDITYATTAADDPVLACAPNPKVQSVWYVYTPSTDGSLSLSTDGSNYETVTNVWSGARGALVSHGCNYVTPFNVTLSGGTTYYIEVAAWDAPGNPRTLQLALEFTPSLSGYPFIEDFNSSTGFTSTDPDLFIQNGKVHWTVYRNGGEQYIYRDIPEFSGPVKLTVVGQVNSATNNCHVKAGIGDAPGSGPAVRFGWFGGGCPVKDYLISASVPLNYSTYECVAGTASDWLWVSGGSEYTATLTIGDSVLLDVPGVGNLNGPAYSSTYNTLYVGLTGGGDWPSCSGTIESITVEPLSSTVP